MVECSIQQATDKVAGCLGVKKSERRPGRAACRGSEIEGTPLLQQRVHGQFAFPRVGRLRVPVGGTHSMEWGLSGHDEHRAHTFGCLVSCNTQHNRVGGRMEC